MTLGAWAATLADPVPPSVSQPTLPKERPRSLSQSALRREEAAPRDWGHFVLAGAGGTRWRHRRSDGVPPGRSRRQWWHRYRRPNSPRPFPSLQRRRGRETSAAAPKQPAERQPPRPPFTNRDPALSERRRSGFSQPTPRPCNANKASLFACLPRFAVLPGGTDPEASILPLEVSGLRPRLHPRFSGWRAAAALRPNLSSEGNTNWCGRSDLAPSGTFIWRSTSPMAR